MLIIAEQELSYELLIDPIYVDPALYPGGVTVVHGKDFGEFTLPIIAPTLAYQFRGFEIFPYEFQTQVAMLAKGVRYYYSAATSRWEIDSTNSLWNTPLEIREGILLWQKPVQFRFRMIRSEGGSAPCLQLIKLGYDVTDQVMEYLLEFGLPGFLSEPIQFARRIDPIDGVTFPYLNSFSSDRVSNLVLTIPGRSRQAGFITHSEGNPKRITVSEPVPGQMHRVLFDFAPLAVRLNRQIFEVPDVPAITVRGLDPTSLRRVNVQTYVQSDESNKIGWESVYVADIPVEITVIGETEDDCQRMLQSIYHRISTQGYLDLPAFGLKMGITPKGSAKNIWNSQNQIIGTLFAHSFQVVCRNVPWGESELPPEFIVTTTATTITEPMSTNT